MKTIKAFSLSSEVIEAVQNQKGKSMSAKVEQLLWFALENFKPDTVLVAVQEQYDQIQDPPTT